MGKRRGIALLFISAIVQYAFRRWNDFRRIAELWYTFHHDDANTLLLVLYKEKCVIRDNKADEHTSKVRARYRKNTRRSKKLEIPVFVYP